MENGLSYLLCPSFIFITSSNYNILVIRLHVNTICNSMISRLQVEFVSYEYVCGEMCINPAYKI